MGVSPDVARDTLYQEYVAREEGYVFAYLSNENATLADVYFDDVTLTLTPGRVIQGNEYYPFGVQTAASWTRESALTNNFLYNGGTELNKTTQVYDLYYRNYDPVLGRFGQVDPMASKYGPVSPYHFAGNNPVVMNDPLGDEYDAFSVMDGSYIASGRGESVYRDMDPYGRYTTARIMAQSIERMSMMRDAQDSELDIADGMHSFVFGSNGEVTYEYKSDQEMLAMIFVYGEDRVRAMYSGTGPIIGNYVGGARLWQAEDGGFVQLKNGIAYVPGTDRRYYGAAQLQTQNGPETWYYMLKTEGGPHGLVYDATTNTIYDANHPNDGETNGLLSWLTGGAKSMGYEFNMSNPRDVKRFWEFGGGRGELMLAPITITNPAAARTFFESNTGKEWDYNFFTNNCKHYACQGFEAGGASIPTMGPAPQIWVNSLFIGRWNSSMDLPYIMNGVR